MKKQKAQRTNYRVDIPKLKEYAALMASNGLGLTGYQAALDLLTKVMFAQRGMDKRPLTPDECTRLIHQGGFK